MRADRKSADIFFWITKGIVVAILYALPATTFAQCAAGTQPAATEADVALMKLNGITNAAIGMCWKKDDANVGQEAGEAKQYLQQHAIKNANISCLNATFAERLKNLLQAVPGGPPTITDGYRSPQAQANLPKGSTQVGPCGSYHQYGMAADFNQTNSQTLTWMRVHAAQYGLSPVTNANPVTGCTPHNFCDSGHIQIAGPRPPVSQCGICATSGGDGTQSASASSNTPLSSMFNAAQTLFSPQQSAAPAQSSPVSSVPVSQPTQQALTSAYQTPTTQTTSGTTQTSVPVSSSVPASTVLSASNTSGSSGSSNTSSSALDALNAIAYPDLATPTATSATGTLLTLNNALNDQHQGIQTVPGGTPPAASGQVPLAIANQVSELHQPNTFTSPDMNQDFTQQSTANPSSNTFMGTVLDSIQQTLLSMLTVLQPFGGNGLVSQPMSHSGVME